MECWYCKKFQMALAPEHGKGWYKCIGCGATHQANPTIPVVSVLGSVYLDDVGYRHYHSVKTAKKRKAKK